MSTVTLAHGTELRAASVIEFSKTVIGVITIVKPFESGDHRIDSTGNMSGPLPTDHASADGFQCAKRFSKRIAAIVGASIQIASTCLREERAKQLVERDGKCIGECIHASGAQVV